MLAGTALAQVGDPGPGMAYAGYFPATGEIVVSINGVNNWYIESASGALTGSEPIFGTIPGALITNDDNFIGETSFATATAIDHSLGNVTAAGIEYGDLTLNWNAGLGMPLQTVAFGPRRPPEFATINGPFVIDLATDPLNIRLEASDSGISGSPDFRWDVDGIPGYEIITDEVDYLDIPDVTETFGGVGVYTVTVGVGFFEGFDTASTTVTIINSVPEPTTLSLAILSLLALVSRLRKLLQ